MGMTCASHVFKFFSGRWEADGGYNYAPINNVSSIFPGLKANCLAMFSPLQVVFCICICFALIKTLLVTLQDSRVQNVLVQNGFLVSKYCTGHACKALKLILFLSIIESIKTNKKYFVYTIVVLFQSVTCSSEVS